MVAGSVPVLKQRHARKVRQVFVDSVPVDCKRCMSSIETIRDYVGNLLISMAQ